MISDTDGNETMVRDAFDRLLADEPPLRVDACAAIDAGRRATRHRLGFRLSAAAAVLAVATATLASTVNHGSAPRAASGTTAATTPVANPLLHFTSATGRVPLDTTGRQPTSALDAKIIDAIRSASPSGWTFQFGGGGTDASTVDGTADDGSGPGRLMVFAWPGAGGLTREPCHDPDFVAGATCTETHLAGDVILSVRGLLDFQGIETYEISLTHADGSGVGAEAGNFKLPPMPKEISVLPGKVHLARPEISRPAPTYNADQLAAVVVAVDAAVNS